MSNEWKNFVVTIKYVTDLNGKRYSYQIPPAWKTELLIWDVLENSPELEASDFESALNAVDTVCKILEVILIDLRPEDSIDEIFDSGTIESIFSDVWQSMQNANPKSFKDGSLVSTQTPSDTDDFSMAKALAMFACECGWTPEQVLALPKIQVIELTSAISEHTSQRLKFQAAIHGVPIEDSASSSVGAQINIEDQIREFSSMGLPVEVK